MSLREQLNQHWSERFSWRVQVLSALMLALIGITLYVDRDSMGLLKLVAVTAAPAGLCATFAVLGTHSLTRALCLALSLSLLLWAAASLAVWPRDIGVGFAIPAGFGVVLGGLLSLGVSAWARSYARHEVNREREGDAQRKDV